MLITDGRWNYIDTDRSGSHCGQWASVGGNGTLAIRGTHGARHEQDDTD
jgi:hypothetical protein